MKEIVDSKYDDKLKTPSLPMVEDNKSSKKKLVVTMERNHDLEAIQKSNQCLRFEIACRKIIYDKKLSVFHN